MRNKRTVWSQGRLATSIADANGDSNSINKQMQAARLYVHTNCICSLSCLIKRGFLKETGSQQPFFFI